MELEEIRSLTLKALRVFNTYSDNSTNFPETKQITNVLPKVEQMMYRVDPDREQSRFASNEIPYRRMNEDEKKYFLESIHNLFIEGVIVWGKDPEDYQTGFYPYFSITPYGERVLEKEEIIPHDPDNYLEHLKKIVPNLDPLILMYVQESLQCFLRNIPNASSVMLGVASERVFDLLFESFQNYIQDQRVIEKFELAKKRASLKQRYDLVEKELERHKVNLSPNVKENLDINLAGIFTLIRLQRNDSGHPTGLSIDRDQMFVHLRMFVMYCKTIYDVIDSLQKADHSFH